jgi:potassium-transporting ATPase KdpC subunit
MDLRQIMKLWLTGLRTLLCFTLLTGVIYPLLVTGIATGLFPEKVSGSLIRGDGRILGSELLGQRFIQPQYFWPRPSAVSYEGSTSAATNWSPSSQTYVKSALSNEANGAIEEMRFSSASGLDPHLSPAAAKSQILRVLKARNSPVLTAAVVEKWIDQSTESRQFGFLGQPRVNVLRLNLALDSALRE